MFAISFDMLISDLKEHYGATYNNAYYDIAVILEKYEFIAGKVVYTCQPKMTWPIY